ncbi:MAG: hypothetical protein ACOYOK_13650 [Pseudobdellovibrionaceae bacterium]
MHTLTKKFSILSGFILAMTLHFSAQAEVLSLDRSSRVDDGLLVKEAKIVDLAYLLKTNVSLKNCQVSNVILERVYQNGASTANAQWADSELFYSVSFTLTDMYKNSRSIVLSENNTSSYYQAPWYANLIPPLKEYSVMSFVVQKDVDYSFTINTDNRIVWIKTPLGNCN